MKLRWLIRRDAVSREEVVEFAHAQGLPLMTAKKVLTRERVPVLQASENGTDWIDIPYVVLPHDQENQSG